MGGKWRKKSKQWPIPWWGFCHGSSGIRLIGLPGCEQVWFRWRWRKWWYSEIVTELHLHNANAYVYCLNVKRPAASSKQLGNISRYDWKLELIIAYVIYTSCSTHITEISCFVATVSQFFAFSILCYSTGPLVHFLSCSGCVRRGKNTKMCRTHGGEYLCNSLIVVSQLKYISSLNVRYVV